MDCWTAGFKVPAETQIICAECKEVGPNEPLTREKLSPVLAILKAKNTDDGSLKQLQWLNLTV